MAKTIHRAEYRQLVDQLRQKREKLGLSQGELATRLGWSQQKISFIETGARRMDILEYVTVARALGLRPATVFSRAERLIDSASRNGGR